MVVFEGLSLTSLKLCQANGQALRRIPRMIKSFGSKLDSFNGYFSHDIELGQRPKEACFEIQITLLDYLSGQIPILHTILDGEQEMILRYSFLPFLHFTNLQQTQIRKLRTLGSN